MTQARRVDPERAIGALLPGAQFVDSYCVELHGEVADATTAARAMVEHSPPWARRLLALRNAIVRPLGLKDGQADDYGLGKIGFFPIVSQSPPRVVFGLEDKHLDFRASIDVVTTDNVSRVTVTTLVLLHNTLGRAYLTAILPFHRLIVMTWLDRLAAQSASGVPIGPVPPYAQL